MASTLIHQERHNSGLLRFTYSFGFYHIILWANNGITGSWCFRTFRDALCFARSLKPSFLKADRQQLPSWEELTR